MVIVLGFKNLKKVNNKRGDAFTKMIDAHNKKTTAKTDEERKKQRRRYRKQHKRYKAADAAYGEKLTDVLEDHKD
jgi:hypothetical protein